MPSEASIPAWGQDGAGRLAIRSLSMSQVERAAEPVVSAYSPYHGAGGQWRAFESSGGEEWPPPPDLPPTISGGTSSLREVTSNGFGSINGTIPVGAIVSFIVMSPDLDYEIDLATISWSGGTDYKSYMSEPAEDIAPPVGKLQKGVTTNYEIYSFIVDSSPMSYSIEVSVEYTNGASGTSTLTFTSGRPTFSFENPEEGVVTADFVYHPVTLDVYGVIIGVLSNDPIRFTATSGPETDLGLWGEYMIMQIVNIEAEVWDRHPVGGALISWNLKTGDRVQDAGLNGLLAPQPAPLGQGLVEGVSSWEQAEAFGTNTVHLNDSPLIIWSNHLAKSISYHFAAETYLMYRPFEGGVWIALSEFKWSFEVSSTNTQFGNDPLYDWTLAGGFPPDVHQSTPSGDNAFPEWQGSTWDATWHREE